MVVKRPNLGNGTGRAVAVVNGSAANGALIQSVPRTSGLQAPVMELTGHSGEVFATRFDPAGHLIASGSMDRSISAFYSYSDLERPQLTFFSVMENLWRLRKLRCVEWS